MTAIWKRIFDQEKTALEKQAPAAGTVLFTVADLAARYEVCYVTAHRVVKELAKLGLVRNVPKVGCVAVGQVKSYPVYMLTPDKADNAEPNLIISLLTKGVYAEAVRQEIDIQPITLEQVWQLPHDEPLFLLYAYNANFLSSDLMLKFLAPNIFPIALNCNYTLRRGCGIGSDSRQMMFDLTTKFIQQGAKKIGYVGAASGITWEPRVDGFLEALQSNAQEFGPASIFSSDNFSEYLCKLIESWILRHNFDAICTPGSKFARELQNGLRPVILNQVKLGTIGVPTNNSDNLYCIRPNYEEMGARAVQLIRSTDLANLSGATLANIAVPAHFVAFDH